jgi:hypothetical protein
MVTHALQSHITDLEEDSSNIILSNNMFPHQEPQ